MKNFDFNSEQMNVILMGLIQRRDTVKLLAEDNIYSDSLRDSYTHELTVVNSVLESLFPGSVKALER